MVEGEVAEILAATPDGRTLLYTDSARGELGVVDVSRPDRPVQAGAVAVGGSPTSVTVTKDGRHALVGVDTTSDLTAPTGLLAVVDLRSRQVVRTIDLGGQPDSVALSPDGRYAAVAIENQRDEELVVDEVEGGLPQAPAGYLSVVDLKGPVKSWTESRVELTGLPDVEYASDPEPEFVDVNRRNVAAVTLQENNAVALVDLAKREVLGSFSAGTVTRTDADTADDDTVAFDDALTAPREPDAVQWTPAGNLITADEGDLAAEPSGGRGWTVFSPAGDVLFTAGASAEQALAAAYAYDDDRSDDKGAEFEGAEVDTFRSDSYAFIGAERGDAVLVYDLDEETRPELLQVLPTGDEPEGLLALPKRDLFLTSNEGDGSISVFALQRSRGNER
ncbi:hypothetical protein [Blastococcus brunescens]|uniref:Alkaline phosphatase n=1 Tax=Blastococcus brunescens TaxID=1564165 RepID=A0ABZ1B4Z9_9ACTN|nr:hypothetical protein [Blastococcus sp. BMG 8361]WRL65877.1 hypothetical protein U6N30_10145 [Blastococcus sp. BMG 8361]